MLVEDYFTLNKNINETDVINDIDGLLDRDITLKEAQNIFEREYILGALKKHGGSRKTASKILNIDRSYISKLIAKHSIEI